MGREKETPDDAILREFYLHDDPVLVTKEIAEALDMTRQGVHDRLKELEDGGWLHSKKPGRDRIYWLTSEGQQRARDSLRTDSY